MDDEFTQKRILYYELDGTCKDRQKNVKDRHEDPKILNINEDLAADRFAWRSAIKNQRRCELELYNKFFA